MNVERNAITGVFWLGGSSLINRLVLLVVMAVLAVRLDPRDFGMLAVVTLVSTTALTFHDLGFGDALVYEPKRPREAAETTLVMVLMGSTALCITLYVGAPWIAGFFRVPESVGILRVYSFIVLLTGVGRAPLDILTRELAFARRSLLETAPGILGGLVTIALALGGAGVWSLAIGDMARSVLALVMGFLVLPNRPAPRWHPDVAKQMWPFARRSLAGMVLDFGLQNVDYVLIGRLLGPVALGYYSLAFRLAILPFLVVTYVLAGVAFPTLARLFPDMARVKKVFRATIQAGAGAVFLAGGGLVALAPFLQVLGTKWAPAVETARMLGLYVCFRSAAHMVTPLLQAVGAPGSIAWLRASWVASLAVLIGIFSRYGIVAVGMIQVVVASALLIVHALTARRLASMDLGVFIADLARPAIAAVVAGLLTIGVQDLWGIPYDALSGFLALSTLFTTVYLGMLWILQPSLRTELPALLKRFQRQTSG